MAGVKLQLGSTQIDDTFAEAFSMKYTRLVVTACDEYWLDVAVSQFTGYGTSVIACDAETALETRCDPQQTLDGRPGACLLVFGRSQSTIAEAVQARTGQCLMTCPTTAVFNGLISATETISLGRHLRFFGDGYQKSKQLGERRFWRIPVMDGEFIVEQHLGVEKGVAGGNLILQSIDQPQGLAAARHAVDAIAKIPGVITPFPGGVARSGSKVGSRYKGLIASTADAFCPTLRGRVQTKLHPQAQCVYEIVIDGTDERTVGQAMKAGMQAAAGTGVVAISAGNYGGKLGKYHFYLHQLLGDEAT